MSENIDNTETMTLDEAWEAYEFALENARLAEEQKQEAIKFLRDAAGSAMFERDGQLYQARPRGDKWYLCALKRSPKEWLSEARERKIQEAVEARLKAGVDVEADLLEGTVSEDVTPGFAVGDTVEETTTTSGSIDSSALFTQSEEETQVTAVLE